MVVSCCSVELVWHSRQHAMQALSPATKPNPSDLKNADLLSKVAKVVICHAVGFEFIQRSCGLHCKLPASNKPNPTARQICFTTHSRNPRKHNGFDRRLIGGEGNLCAAIAHSSLTTNRYSIKTIVVSWISGLCTPADLPCCWL